MGRSHKSQSQNPVTQLTVTHMAVQNQNQEGSSKRGGRETLKLFFFFQELNQNLSTKFTSITTMTLIIITTTMTTILIMKESTMSTMDIIITVILPTLPQLCITLTQEDIVLITDLLLNIQCLQHHKAVNIILHLLALPLMKVVMSTFASPQD